MAEKKRAKTDKAGKTVTFTIPQVPRPTFSMQSALWRRKWALGVIFLLLAFLSGYGGAIVANNSRDDGLISTTVGNEKKVITSQSQLISKIAQEVGPSVVSITATIASDQPLNETDPFGFGMPAPQSRRSQAAGTGIIISGKGIIVTNRHVVPKGTSRVSVTLSDGTELKNVTVIGRTNDNDSLDIAFLKIHDTKGKKLVPASIGNSASVQVGDDVIAIGNALGQFQNTVTSGIISGYGRSVLAQDDSGGTGADNLDNLFQTDAAINEGNSGGPLVNLSGQVIGINTAVAGNAQNIGFAIPINDVRGLIDQVLKTGKF